MEKEKEVMVLDLGEAEREQRDRIISELNHASDQRKQTYTELDDMNYDQWYLANKKAATGYIKPKQNKHDIRTVTGTTREKCNTVVTALLRYNFDFNVEAYDEKNWQVRELGFGLEGLVKKSRELESPSYEDKRALFYNEFTAQGNLFLLENNVQENITEKKIKNMEEADDVFKVEWTETTKLEQRCEVDMVPGLNIYLGNIREYYIDKQPYLGIRREISFTEAEQTYKNFRRWKYVDGARTNVLTDTGGEEYNDFNLIPPDKDYVEEVRYYNQARNEYQVMVNGIPMLPVAFPLSYALGVNKYPIIKVNGEPISRYFAYCRGIATKNKFNQAMIDEMFKIIVLKFRKSTNPPMANMTGKMLNKSIFYPGTIHQGVDPEKLKQIGDNSAMNGPEFEVFKLVKSAIDESSVSPIFEGNRTPGEKTAKEISDLKTQSLMRLGMIMVGCIQMEEHMIWLRIYNILTNWTGVVDKKLKETKEGVKEINVYRTESIESEFDDGKKGVHLIEMKDGELPSPTQVYAEEEILSRKKGTEVRKTYLNASDLKSLKYKFRVTSTPVEMDVSELKGALFEESMMKALQIFPESVNRPYVMERWANFQKLDPRKLFVQNAPQMPPMAQQMMQGGGIDKTVGAQALPQISQQRKPQLKQMQ